ncbi:MAG: DUF45 domain-containing protein [Bacilli bacterium]|nr:DUF45 domain-containing protein [Bacilli bacterium]MBN2876811.1 DUF45 domain-containing protein [Bacilli bacterium]
MNKIRLDNKTFYYQVFYKNNKNMYLRLSGHDKLVITCNRRVSSKEIETFIAKNSERILKHSESLKNKLPLYRENQMELFGREIQILYSINEKKNHYELTSDSVRIGFKKDHFDTHYLEQICGELMLEKVSEMMIPLKEHTKSFFSVDNVIFKSQLMSSRFGSCIPEKRTIKLNSLLARLPEKYLETILIHELIHLKVFDHQQEFYLYMDELSPNYKQLKKELVALSRKYVI